jgi:hypothetical protein
VNTTNKLQQFGHRRGKKNRRARYDSRAVRSQERLLAEPVPPLQRAHREKSRGDKKAIELF